MSIESLEEMIKKQFPQQQTRSNYVEVVDTPELPKVTGISQESIARDAAKAQAARMADPRTALESQRPRETVGTQEAIPVSSAIREVVAPQRTVQPTQPAPQEKSFADMISDLQRSPSQAPREDIYGSTETEIQRLKSQRSGAGDNGWIDLLGMAIPTVVGASVGQLGAGAIPAGEYGIARGKEIRAQDQKLEEMIAKLASDRAKALGRQKEAADPVKTFLGPDGQPYALRLSQGNALGLPEFKEGSFKDLRIVDPVTGEEKVGLLDQKRGEVKQTDLLAGKNKASSRNERLAKQFQDKERIKALANEIKPTSAINEGLSNLDGIVNANSLLGSGPVGLNLLPSIIARSIGKEKGVLSDRDIGRVQGDPALESRYNRMWSKLINGESLNEFDRKDIRTVLEIAYNVESDRIEKLVKAQKQAYGSVGVDLGSGLEEYYTSRRTTLPKMPPPAISARIRENTPVITGPKKRNGQIIMDPATGQPQMFKYKRYILPDGKTVYEDAQ